MNAALIGYTGFVGSNLIRQSYFEELYNSKNIESIIGRNFELLVCSGTSAVKWLANKEPLEDLKNIERLIRCLGKASAQKVILISTVDVYPLPIQVDEDTPIDIQLLQPYGKHRLEFEEFVKDNFNSLIIRLPGLFGSGLKKNIIYDFLHKNMTEQIHADSRFQFYNLDNLWKDIQAALNHDLKLVNFATEPTSVRDVTYEAFGFDFTNRPHNSPAQYDMRTKHGDLFSNFKGYMYSKNQVLMELKEFVLKNVASKQSV